MCESGYNLYFNNKGCKIRKKDTREKIVEGNRTNKVVYDLSEVNGQKKFIIQSINFDDLLNKLKRKGKRHAQDKEAFIYKLQTMSCVTS